MDSMTVGYQQMVTVDPGTEEGVERFTVLGEREVEVEEVVVVVVVVSSSTA